MNNEELKALVCAANKSLFHSGLVLLTSGNVSYYDRASGIIAIKPSGVPYESLSDDDIVLVDIDGNAVEGNLRPSSDLPTHLELYRAFPTVNSVVHTHSTFATAFAQAHREIPVYGTTHADSFYGPIPCARELTNTEIEWEYERNTGKSIVDTFAGKDPLDTPAALLPGHGVFAWGANAEQALENAVRTEEVAKLAYLTENLSPNARTLNATLQNKHYRRKHGPNAYYGQKK